MAFTYPPENAMISTVEGVRSNMNHGKRSRATPLISRPVSPRHVTKAKPPARCLSDQSVAARLLGRQVDGVAGSRGLYGTRRSEPSDSAGDEARCQDTQKLK
jgi:hypothetical protein